MGRRRREKGAKKLDHRGGEIEGIDVFAEGAFDAGAKDFDCNLFAGVTQGGFVHLRDRGGGDRRTEIVEKLSDAHAKLVCDHALGIVAREGGQFVLQHAQLLGHFLAHHVGAGRKDLAELDVSWSQCSDRAGDGGHGGIALVAQPLERKAQKAGHEAHRSRRVERIQHDAHGAGAFQRGTRADKPPYVMRTAHLPGFGSLALIRPGGGPAPHASRDIWKPKEARDARGVMDLGQIFHPECSAAMPIDRLRYLAFSKPASRIICRNVSWSGKLRIDSTRY